MTCSRCKEAYASGKPENFGSEPECAFKTEVFDSSNWQCATMNELREIVEAWAYAKCVCNADQWAAILPIMKIDAETNLLIGTGRFIVLGWYKHRGRTEAACELSEGNIVPLTLAVAEAALAAAVEKEKADD